MCIEEVMPLDFAEQCRLNNIAELLEYFTTHHLAIPKRRMFEIDIDFFDRGQNTTTLENLLKKVEGINHSDVLFQLYDGELSLFLNKEETDEEYVVVLTEIMEDHVRAKQQRREQYLKLRDEFKSEE